MKESVLVIWFLLLTLVHPGPSVVIAQLPGPTPTQSPRTEEELAHFGDVIDVDVVGGFEFDWRGTLTPDGNLDGLDAFNGPIQSICRSETEIASDVAKALSKILRDPKVVVKIIDRSNRAVVRLDGAVRTPSRYKLQRPVRLGELLVLAGGFTDAVSGEISIFRPRNLNCIQANIVAGSPPDNGSQFTTIKISDLLMGNAPANIQILSGDTIEVIKADPVYVIGAVNSPRPVYSRAEITVSRAVASAGGLARDADGGKVSIFRRSGTEPVTTETDLAKIKRGESPDVVLKAFDIVDVAGKNGGKRKYSPLEADGRKTDRAQRELPLSVIDSYIRF